MNLQSRPNRAVYAGIPDQL
eukprot:IDg22538t1